MDSVEERQEQVIRAVDGALLAWMDGHQWTRTRLAKALGRSESKIAAILGGSNITLRTLGTLLWAIGVELEVKLVRRKATRESAPQANPGTDTPVREVRPA